MKDGGEKPLIKEVDVPALVRELIGTFPTKRISLWDITVSKVGSRKIKSCG
jgi:hypothetical protein